MQGAPAVALAPTGGVAARARKLSRDASGDSIAVRAVCV